MIKSVFLGAIFLMNVFISFSQNQTDSLGLAQGKWVFPSEFDSITNLKNVFVSCEFKNDTLHGPYKIYDNNEKLRYEVVCYNGLRQGIGYIYDADFKVRYIHTYCDDKIVSIIQIDEKNRLFITKGYKDDEQIGFNSIFYNNGRQISRKIFFKGKQNGEETSFKKNGNILGRQKYLDDIFIGVDK